MADYATTAIGLVEFTLKTLQQIQLAREFEDEFETYQLKLDIIQIRLARWAEIIDIAALDTVKGQSDQAPAAIKEVLANMHSRLSRTQREADKMRKKLDASHAQVLDAEACMPVDLKMMRNKLMACLRKRKAQAVKAKQSIKWVFYQKDQCDAFVRNMTEFIDALEKMLPEEERQKLRELSNQECEGINKANLEDLKDIVDGCDPWLESSVDEKLNSGGGNVVNQSHNIGSVVGVAYGAITNSWRGVTHGNVGSQTFA